MEESAKRRRTGGNDGTAGGASSTDASTEGQEAASSWRHDYKYEVFLSFRGPDTRQGFTDFLYRSLKRVGICTFRDDDELPMGGKIGPELFEAIEQSKILIPIFSKGYASSEWCLNELVRMVECEEDERQKIRPIFYDVRPSEVRDQTGNYVEAFRSHEKQYDKDTICKWRAALCAVAEKKGWDLLSKTTRREGEFAEEVTEQVFRELKQAHLAVSDHLVSVDNDVNAIMEVIGAPTSETQIIGIHGMGGIGKTTIAKIIYNKLSSNFNNCCFLANIRETSITCLQKQLISDILKKHMDINNREQGIDTIKKRLSNKRVLLLLDDVEEEDHINALVGKRDWYDRGSKIIITTRKKDILYALKVDTYELSVMDDHRSLQLFTKHAFRGNSPLDEDMDRSIKAIRIAGGLPLALEVIGSLLCRTEKEKWDGQLKEWENVPPQDVMSTLKISYNALRDREKHIFLDIACLFIGYDKDIVVHFWDAPQLSAEVAIGVLQNMSLIKIIEDNKVWMHDQLRDLGREIVRPISNTKTEQSRVWDPKEGLDLLRKHKGEKRVEALRLKLDNHRQYRFSYEGFENLSHLTFLEVSGSMTNFHAEDKLLWHDTPSNVFPTNENSNLLPQLRWLSWPKIPPTFDITNFSMEDVVILNLSKSKITHNWKGWSHMKVMKDLKVMNLTDCIFLERTPDFSAHSKLERLILRGCSQLVEIDKSICQLKSLVFLDVSSCRGLRKLPDEMGRESLEGLPNTFGYLKSLTELVTSGTMMKELPDVLWTMEKLEVIKAKQMHCLHLKIGDCINKNRSLRILKVSNGAIHVVPELPESLINLTLTVLHMDMFPNLSNLTNLKKLNLCFSKRRDFVGPMEEDLMPRWIWNLSKLESLTLGSRHVTALPTDIRSLFPQLKSLKLSWCPNLHCLPSLPSTLSKLQLCSDCLTTLPTDMSSFLPRLESLTLKCPNLHCLPSLPSSLCSLELYNCESGCSVEELSNLKTLSYLRIDRCAISEIPVLDRLENLEVLQLEELQHVEILPDLSNLNKLRSLQLWVCDYLVEIQGDLPPSLEELMIRGCGSLWKLPDLSNLKGLGRVLILGCQKLNVEAIYSFCSKKGIQYLGDQSQSDYESEREDDESGGESDYESEGEDDKSGGESDYESEGEDDE